MKVAQLDVYSHGCRFTRFGLKFAHLLGDFLRNSCLQTRRRRDARSGRVVVEALNTFAAARSDFTEVYLLREQLEHFWQFAHQRGFKKEYLDIIEHQPVPGKKVSFTKIWEFPWKEEQEEWLAYMDKGLANGMSLNTAGTGVGKMQPLSSKIKVPGGWTTMGDIKVGDTVTAADGTPTKVLKVFEHPRKKVFKITFADGRTTLAGGKHLWKCYRPGWRSYHSRGDWRVIDTNEMRRILTLSTNRLFIPLCASEELDDVKLDKDPYDVGLTLDYDELIPEPYLNASHAQRLALFSGLPLAVKGETIHYRTRNPELAQQVRRLAWSLGGSAECVVKKGVVCLSMRFAKQMGQGKLAVVSVEPAGVMDCRCIMIDHPEHLYVTDDHIVTHNSSMSMEIVFRRSVRTAMVLSPKFIKNWHVALFKFFDFEEGDVIEVRGKDTKKPPHPKIPVYSMLEFQDAVERGLEFKIVIISINLMQRYISDYEANNCVEPYLFHPMEFWEKCGVGCLVHDEAHLWSHFLFKVQCYSNIPEILYLSATVEGDDQFVDKMTQLMYPMNKRFRGGKWDKYIVSTAVTYALRSTEKIRYKGFSGSYSHIKFEQSILKHQTVKKAYYGFIFKVISSAFMTTYQEGQKMLVYCASVEMCQSLAAYLQERLPTLVIGAYTQKEDFETLMENDISVTTVMSAGTGLDIPNLVFTFMTIAMGSKQGNIQVLGRLRKLRGEFEGHTPQFYYLVCRDIEAHRKYHFKKVECFSDKVLTQRVLDTDFEL